ncbi:HAD-IC family P-type ATPase [Acholeplasma hippikon]|uniref:Calcium-transporting ATPase lmo0841 n=1 Tax=Acholeplasma hippikon TaxID=264636 RepID=A0A449BKD4_9MOLU|nr:HAD-IC family P-type ATPase [Acholeplasma hippikon]VEU82926.1 Calcium-transporting ATPase lmo0841 [Acholeplasma hippikon]
MAKNSQNELLSLLEEANQDKGKKSKQKGPKTVIVEEPLAMSGDPLGLIQTNKQLSEAKTPARIKSKNDVVVERYNPEVLKGLTSDDVEQRQLAGMANISEKGSTKTVGKIIFTNVFTFFNLLIVIICGLLIWSGASITQTASFFIATINTIIGIIQEINAKKMIDKLSLLSAPTAIVIRDSSEQEISTTEVVIDDIIKLTSGKQIIVDAVVREGSIEVNESLLTGESDPIIKKAGDTLYSGSFVISGSCYAQATAIGGDIYIEKLTSQAKKYKKPKSDIFKSLGTIILVVGFIIVPVGITLYLLAPGAWNDPAYIPTNIIKSAGAMLGMIPSGLFLLTTVTLAVGVVRLGQNNTLVQELYCIEMLARIDTLCLDKTGTITDGTMTVKSVIEYESIPGLPLKQLVSAILNAQNDQNLTSEALYERFGNQKRIRHKALIPFSSARKYSAVEFEKYGTFALGAPEFVLKHEYNQVAKEVEKQANEGYRVLVIAHTDAPIENNQLEGKLKPIALIMIEDTIRPDAPDTIQYFKDNGVNVVVISGDNPITVSRISQRAGIENAENYISLEGLSDKDVVRAANKYTVFGRVSPQQKKLLIESMKNNGHTVAMTGDGVNDILALKEADTSIAMASGSEAARNVSHLVLMDSNFASMPKVVSEGRRVINNIQRVSKLYLTKTLLTILLSITVIIRALMGHDSIYPLKPSHLLIMEFLVIAIPSFVLALEYNNQKITGKFLAKIIKDALPGALVVLINALIIYGLAMPLGMDISTIEGEVAISTLIGISATATSFMVLFTVSRPLNVKRSVMFFGTLITAILAVLLLPEALEYTPIFSIQNVTRTNPLSLSQILLLIVLIYSSYPMMYIITNIVRWLKIVAKKTVHVISDMK